MITVPPVRDSPSFPSAGLSSATGKWLLNLKSVHRAQAGGASAWPIPDGCVGKASCLNLFQQQLGLRPRQELLYNYKPAPNYTWPQGISLENLGGIPLPQMITRCCCLSKAHRAVWGVGGEVTPRAGPCSGQCTQHLRDGRATGTQLKFSWFYLCTHVPPAKSLVSEDVKYMVFSGFTLHCKSRSQSPMTESIWH